MGDLDLHTFAALYGGPGGPLAPAMVALTLLGGGWAALALLPLVALPGWPRTRTFAAVLSLAVLAQATLVWAIKLATARVRPWIAMNLPAPIGAPHDFSFPSGLAAGSFCVAAFLVVALPAALPGGSVRVRAAGPAAVAIAAMIAASRVYLGAHFPSDVVAGAILGGAIGAGAGNLYASRLRERDGQRQMPREGASAPAAD